MSGTAFGEGRNRRSGIPSFIERPLRRTLSRMALHENVRVREGLRVGRGVVVSSPHGLDLGAWASIGPYTVIQVDGQIGDFAMIGMRVQIVGRYDHAIDELGVPMIRATAVSERPAKPGDSVDIGDDVWIGGGSTVLSGIRVGHGALIGAASVVTTDVPPFAIVVGNPARVVGMRFTDEAERAAHLQGVEDLRERLRVEGQRGRRRPRATANSAAAMKTSPNAFGV